MFSNKVQNTWVRHRGLCKKTAAPPQNDARHEKSGKSKFKYK